MADHDHHSDALEINQMGALNLVEHASSLIDEPLGVRIKPLVVGEDEKLEKGVVRGENGACALTTSGSCVLDLFFQLVPHVAPSTVDDLLDAAWNESARDTLKIIFQTGNARTKDAGKMDRPNFYVCLKWLWRLHPDVLFLNLREVPKHACLKDLLELLQYAIQFSAGVSEPLTVAGKRQHTEALLHKQQTKWQRRTERVGRREGLKEEFTTQLQGSLISIDYLKTENQNDAWLKFVKDRDSERAAIITKQIKNRQQQLDLNLEAFRRNGLASNSEDNITSTQSDSVKCWNLHVEVASIFAEGLRNELQQLSHDPSSVTGFFAKWAPSSNGAHDKATRLVGTISALIFPTVGDLADANTFLSIPFQQRILSPLRAAEKVPEHFIGKGRWDQVDYNRMPSRCRMLFGERLFHKWDKVRICTSLINSLCIDLFACDIFESFFTLVSNRGETQFIISKISRVLNGVSMLSSNELGCEQKSKKITSWPMCLFAFSF